MRWLASDGHATSSYDRLNAPSTHPESISCALCVSIGMYPGITVSGTVGYTYIIQSTSDLSDTNSWVTVATLTLEEPIQLWVDINVNAFSASNPHRFYRVLPGE